MSSISRAVGAHLVRRGAREDERAAVLLSIEGGAWLLTDDTQTQEQQEFMFKFPDTWSVHRASRWVGGTETRFDGEGLGSFEMTVTGSSLEITGSAPLASEGHTFLVSVDGGEPYEAHFQDDGTNSNSTYRTWLTVINNAPPKDPMNTIRVSLTGLPPGTGVDYVTTHVDERFFWDFKHLAIVDDAAPMMLYNGNWAQHGTALGRMHNSTVHSTTTVGDSMTVRFIGSTVSLYGLFGSETGTISASFTLDDEPPRVLSHAYSPSIRQNVPFFSLNDLQPRLHTLTVALTESTNNTGLAIDFMTYDASIPSVKVLRERPEINWTMGQAPPKKMNPATTAGAVIGVLAAVFVLLGLFCCRGGFRNMKRNVKWRWQQSRKGTEQTGRGTPTANGTKEELESSRSPYFSFKKAAKMSTTSFDAASTTHASTRTVSPPPVCLNIIAPSQRNTPQDRARPEKRITPFNVAPIPTPSEKTPHEQEVRGEKEKAAVSHGHVDCGDLEAFRFPAPAHPPAANTAERVGADQERAERTSPSATQVPVPPMRTAPVPTDEKLRVDFGHKITPFDVSSSLITSSSSDAKAALKARDAAEAAAKAPVELEVPDCSNCISPPAPVETRPSNRGRPPCREEKLRLDFGHKITPFDVSSHSSSTTSFSSDSKSALKARRDLENAGQRISPFTAARPSAAAAAATTAYGPTTKSRLPGSRSLSEPSIAPRHITAQSSTAATPCARRRRASLQARLDELLAETECDTRPVAAEKVEEMKRLVKEIELIARDMMRRGRTTGTLENRERDEEELPPYEMEVGRAF